MIGSPWRPELLLFCCALLLLLQNCLCCGSGGGGGGGSGGGGNRPLPQPQPTKARPPPTVPPPRCYNGGTYDNQLRYCFCPMSFHGSRCERSFAAEDPCDKGATLPDISATRRVGNTQLCSGSQCVQFNSLSPGWYKLQSPAGSHFISAYTCLNSTVNCGSEQPYVVAEMQSENNPGRPLFRAKFFPHDSRFPNCYASTGSYYPVRILDCTTVQLYFLVPTLSSQQHYCIGDKRRCPDGLRSSDGNGFEPCFNASCIPSRRPTAAQPQLTLEPPKNRGPRFFFCRVADQFTMGDGAVRNRVSFLLRFVNGTEREVTKCRAENVSIAAGGESTFNCSSEDVLPKYGNVYGGTLRCSVQARCLSDSYNSEIINSNVHRFEFDYRLLDNSTGQPATRISPDNRLQMCINIADVPTTGRVDFSMSVARRGVIPSDRIALLMEPQYSNGTNTCKYSLFPNLGRTRACVLLMLINGDDNGWIPRNMHPDQQVSELLINVSYSSNGKGIDTFGWRNGSSGLQWVELQRRALIVDLSSLYVTSSDYFHMYYDPWVKPADTASRYLLRTPGGHYNILHNKHLSYDVQTHMMNDFVVEVAVRYGYYIIKIRADSSTGELRHNIVEKLPPGISSNPIPLVNGVPLGITIRSNRGAVGLHFELYGTRIFAWKFNMPGMSTNCRSAFYLLTSDFESATCNTQASLRVKNWEVLDVSVTPGFFDTKKTVTGLFYHTSDPQSHRLSSTDSRNLFSSSYVMPLMPQPTQLIDLCTCDGRSTGDSTCLLNVRKAERSRRRRSTDSQPVAMPQSSPTSTSIAFNETKRRNISESEAAAACADFAAARGRGSLSGEVCANVTSIVGGADLMTQFQEVCVQYAVTMGTLSFTADMFADFARLCLKEIEMDVEMVTTKPEIVAQVAEELCPANCSGNGNCSSGVCRCVDGFVGDACDVAVGNTTEYSIHQLHGTSRLCPVDNCSFVYVDVRPLLPTTDAECRFASDGLNRTIDASSDHMGGSAVRCPVTQLAEWLRSDAKLYVTARVQLVTAGWNSSNSLTLVLHSSCDAGSTFRCSDDAKNCSCIVNPTTAPPTTTATTSTSLANTTSAAPTSEPPTTQKATTKTTATTTTTAATTAATGSTSSLATRTTNPKPDKEAEGLSWEQILGLSLASFLLLLFVILSPVAVIILRKCRK